MRTSALTFGRFDILAIAICYALYLGGMAWAGWRLRLGVNYWGGLSVALVLAGYHLALIRGRDRDQCFRAFLSNHWLGFAIFIGVVADFAVRVQSWPRTY